MESNDILPKCSTEPLAPPPEPERADGGVLKPDRHVRIEALKRMRHGQVTRPQPITMDVNSCRDAEERQAVWITEQVIGIILRTDLLQQAAPLSDDAWPVPAAGIHVGSLRYGAGAGLAAARLDDDISHALGVADR